MTSPSIFFMLVSIFGSEEKSFGPYSDVESCLRAKAETISIVERNLHSRIPSSVKIYCKESTSGK